MKNKIFNNFFDKLIDYIFYIFLFYCVMLSLSIVVVWSSKLSTINSILWVWFIIFAYAHLINIITKTEKESKNYEKYFNCFNLYRENVVDIKIIELEMLFKKSVINKKLLDKIIEFSKEEYYLLKEVNYKLDDYNLLYMFFIKLSKLNDIYWKDMKLNTDNLDYIFIYDLLIEISNGSDINNKLTLNKKKLKEKTNYKYIKELENLNNNKNKININSQIRMLDDLLFDEDL